ncbi:MAG: sulfite exporter TauE/SafE family protein [Bryobacterales bacterium]|nr:sulfite exporter TauE/SafE family protein [Bryobacterales bacterium]
MLREQGATLLVILILFAGTLVRSALGFGEALIAVPLLALVLPVEVAAPTAVLVSITIALVIFAQEWRSVHYRSAGWLLLSTLFGIPAGLYLLKAFPAPVVKAILGVVIAGFSLYSLRARRRAEWKDDRFAWVFGWAAGVLGGAYGMNGPPLVIYGAHRGWTPERFRATLQAYFLPASIAGMGGYWAAGLWTAAVNRYYLISLPAVFGAIFLGRYLHRRLPAERFFLAVYVSLMAIGGVLVFQAAGGWRG